MHKGLKRGLAIVVLGVAMLAVPVAAFAEASMDFELKELTWEDGQAVAKGTITNTGDKEITHVDRVDVEVYFGDKNGDHELISDSVFEDLDISLQPGESKDQRLIFTRITEEDYNKSTTWYAEEKDWKFTYID